MEPHTPPAASLSFSSPVLHQVLGFQRGWLRCLCLWDYWILGDYVSINSFLYGCSHAAPVVRLRTPRPRRHHRRPRQKRARLCRSAPFLTGGGLRSGRPVNREALVPAGGLSSSLLSGPEASGSRNKHRLDRRLRNHAFIRNHFPLNGASGDSRIINEQTQRAFLLIVVLFTFGSR